MGLITKVSFAEQIAAINGAIEDIKGEWDKTIYVDQANGDDSNPGTQDAPVASLQKAFDLVPSGGTAIINLLSDYVIDAFIDGRDKNLNVKIKKYDDSLVNISQKIKPYKNYNTGMSFKNLTGGITFYKCNFSIIDESDPDKPFDSYVQFISRAKRQGGILTISILNSTINLASVSEHKYFKTDGVFSPFIAIALYSTVINKNAGRLLEVQGTASFNIYGNTYVQDGSWTEVITGIIRDVDGKPRNLITNFVI